MAEVCQYMKSQGCPVTSGVVPKAPTVPAKLGARLAGVRVLDFTGLPGPIFEIAGLIVVWSMEVDQSV
jgi:hypothetical protein